MDNNDSAFETLKEILRHIRYPDELNDHAWTRSLFVEQARLSTPQLAGVSPGQQLISALAGLFPELQPAAPPRTGKRLDPRWGEYGLLAALYFMPFHHGTSYPTSLLDAWGRIDQAILTSVYGEPVGELAEEQIQRYRLVGGEIEYGSPSTLSDWHRKGLQRLTEVILNRERCLARTSTRTSVILDPDAAQTEPQRSEQAAPGKYSILKHVFGWTVLLLLVAVLGAVALKGWRIYQSAMIVHQNADELREIAQGRMDLDTLATAIPRLSVLQIHLAAFKEEAQPFLWLCPRLGWIPEYGDDLAAIPPSIEMSEHLLNAALLSVQTAQPLLNEFDSQYSALNVTDLTAILLEMEPALSEARQEVDAALAARSRIEAEQLDSRLRNLIEDDIDPILKLADQGLALGMALPNVLGSGPDGPKTYMLLIQNEDELRPTGGFITSIGHLVLHNGEIIRLEFESVDADVQEDWSRPYPAAPWQMQEYMNSRVLILRDANWFSDFPTTARWAEYLYAYTHSHSVDGIIAVDQQFLVMLLAEIGPLRVEDAPNPLTHQNVIEYMRQSKIPSAEEAGSPGWYRKEFIGNIANAILGELTSGSAHDWRGISQVFLRALEERHLLLQFDDPVLAALITERGWDNAVRPPEGDYLMVTDTNIGFNKTNAAVDLSLTYEVDLRDIAAPVSTLTLSHKNNAGSEVPCIQWDDTGQISPVIGEEEYPISRCYWTYTRVYKQAGVALLDATPHAIPGEWMILHERVPARVDTLDEELQDAQGFGTLLVVPGGKRLDTMFQFALTDTVVSAGEASGEYRFGLKVQKQPGTRANSMTLRIQLPDHAVLTSTPPGAVLQDQILLFETNLRTDVELEIFFSMPVDTE